jgi:hypothetical protein
MDAASKELVALRREKEALSGQVASELQAHQQERSKLEGMMEAERASLRDQVSRAATLEAECESLRAVLATQKVHGTAREAATEARVTELERHNCDPAAQVGAASAERAVGCRQLRRDGMQLERVCEVLRPDGSVSSSRGQEGDAPVSPRSSLRKAMGGLQRWVSEAESAAVAAAHLNEQSLQRLKHMEDMMEAERASLRDRDEREKCFPVVCMSSWWWCTYV